MAWRVASPRMVGRARELGTLLGALDEARRGGPSIVIVQGEAGVGKSRLVREFIDSAREEDVIVLCGSCVRLVGSELPYAPVTSALREIGRIQPPAVRDLPPDALAELAQIVPELAMPDMPPSTRLDSGRYAQARLFELLLGLLRRVAEAAPVALVLEDLHWADHSTVDLISFLAQNIRGERLALLLTYRTDEVNPAEPFERLVTELTRLDRVDCVALERLRPEDVAAQIGAILGRPAGAQLAADVFARSGGNAFFTEVLVAAHASGEWQEVPASVRDALLLPFRSLSAVAQSVTRAVAVIARDSEQDLVGAVTGLGEPELSTGLREAVRGHVLRTRRGRFAFRHALMQEAVHEDLLPGESAALHRAAADALADRSSVPAAEMAVHLSAAGDEAGARDAFVAAGHAAGAVHAHAEALRHFEAALARSSRTGAERLDVLRSAADEALLAGEYERADELCREALTLVDPVGDALSPALLHERLARARYWDLEASNEAYATALALLSQNHGRERARLLAAQGHTLMGMGRWEEARERALAAVALAGETGAPMEEGMARTTLGVVLGFMGDLDGGEQQLRAARDLADVHSPADARVEVRIQLAEVQRLRGSLEDAHDVSLEGAAIATRHGMEASLGRFLKINAADDLFRLGRWDTARTYLAELDGLPLGRLTSVFRDTLVGQIATARGDWRAAHEALEAAERRCGPDIPAEYPPGLYAAKAELALWQHDLGAALEAVDEGFRLVGNREDALNAPELYRMALRVHAAVAANAEALGDRERAVTARAAGAGLLERVERLVLAGDGEPVPAAAAFLATCRAEAAHPTGEVEIGRWRAAVAAWRSLRQPYPAAYARRRLAEALLAGGDRASGVEDLRAAHAVAAELGAEALRRDIETVARHARVSVGDEKGDAVGGAPTAAEQLGLTARELDVLRLLADGLTNRQIAERLFISANTAGVHVSHILGKLRVGNRAAAATAAHRLGLVDRERVPG